MRKIAAIFFPYFFAALARKAHPELRKHPLVIYREEKVIGFSPRLVNQSLLGIPLARARGRCPEAIFTALDQSAASMAQNSYLEILSGFSPVIEPLDEQECFIDLTGCKNIEPMKEVLGGQGLGPCLIGIGTSKLIARLAARRPFYSGRKLSALHVVEVDPDRAEGFMADIPLTMDWHLAPRTLKRLLELGFTNFRDVQGLSLEELVRVSGRDGHILYRHCRGVDDTHLIGIYPPQKLACRFDFEGGISNALSLQEAMGRGAAMMSSILQNRKQGCRFIQLELAGERHNCQAERSLLRGCQDEARLLEILKLMLQGTSIGEPATDMTIQLSGLYDWAFSEQDIFSMNKKSTVPARDIAETARLLQEKMPGKIFQGMKTHRREQVLALWDPWRYEL